MSELEGSKSLLKSKTVHGNLLSIVATVASAVAMLKSGVPPEIAWSVVTTAGAAIWGNFLSILGRKSATVKID